jgi:hypothetical protein
MASVFFLSCIFLSLSETHAQGLSVAQTRLAHLSTPGHAAAMISGSHTPGMSLLLMLKDTGLSRKKQHPVSPPSAEREGFFPPPPPPRWMAVLAFNLSAPTTLSTNELGPLIVDGCARLIIAADVVAHRAWDPSKSNYISRSPAPPLRHHQIADVRVPRSAVSHTIAAFRKHAFILLCPRFPNPIPRNGFDRFSKSFSTRLVPLAQKRRATEATLVGRAGLKPSAVVAFEFSFSGAVRHGHGRPH